MTLVKRLIELREKATKGPWEADTVWMSDVHYSAYQLIGADGQPFMDTINSQRAAIEEEHDEDTTRAWDEQGRRDAALICELVNNLDTIIAALSTEGMVMGAPFGTSSRRADQAAAHLDPTGFDLLREADSAPSLGGGSGLPDLPRVPIRFARPLGETFKDMQRNAQQSELYKHGDMILVWVNEGDFIMNKLVQFPPTRVSDEHLKGEDRNGLSGAAMPARSASAETPDPIPDTSGTEAKPVAWGLPESGPALAQVTQYQATADAWREAGYTQIIPLYASPLPVTEDIAGLIDRLKDRAAKRLADNGYSIGPDILLQAAQALLSLQQERDEARRLAEHRLSWADRYESEAERADELQQKVKELEEAREKLETLSYAGVTIERYADGWTICNERWNSSQAQAEALKREVERKNKALEDIPRRLNSVAWACARIGLSAQLEATPSHRDDLLEMRDACKQMAEIITSALSSENEDE
jgi:hypothetical protein